MKLVCHVVPRWDRGGGRGLGLQLGGVCPLWQWPAHHAHRVCPRAAHHRTPPWRRHILLQHCLSLSVVVRCFPCCNCFLRNIPCIAVPILEKFWTCTLIHHRSNGRITISRLTLIFCLVWYVLKHHSVASFMSQSNGYSYNHTGLLAHDRSMQWLGEQESS